MTMLNGLRIIDTLPLAALEVGKHWYWEIGNLKLHGQVFMASWVVIALLIIASLLATRNIQMVPSGMQNFMEYVLEFLRDLARTQLGEKHYRPWLPFIGTLFLFIFVSIPFIPILLILNPYPSGASRAGSGIQGFFVFPGKSFRGAGVRNIRFPYTIPKGFPVENL